MADVVIVNRSASGAVQGVLPGAAAKVVGLTDAQVAAAATTPGVVVLAPGTPGKTRHELAEALSYWSIAGDAAANRMG